MSDSYFVEHFLRGTNLHGFNDLHMEVAIIVTLSQPSIIATCSNHVAQTHYFKKS